MMRLLLVFLAATIPVSNSMGQADGSELDFFLGEWDVSLLDEDGAIVGKARTTAYEILDGTAIQDDWRSLNRNGDVIFRGTSIRTFVPETKKWVVHWVMAGTEGHTYIDATWENGELLGTGRGFDGRGDFIERYRYHAITDTSYSFHLERSYDGGTTWEFMNDTQATKR
jgi:hypothetical protein